MNRLLKTSIIFLGFSLFAVLFTNIYAVFGHGVRSRYMDLMFLAPLAASLVFLLLFLLHPNVCGIRGYRLFLNTFCSGVATLTAGLLLRGVISIAGSSSFYVPWFIYIGAAASAVGVVMLPRLLISVKGKHEIRK